MTSIAFWDASALVPLFADQAPYTENSRALLSRYRVCVWWGTTVEVESAFCRLHRLGGLSDTDWNRCQNELDRESANWFLVEPSEAVRTQARTLLRLYALRAGDALQLAAALVWCEDKPQDQVFLSTDRRLAEVASQRGFTVL